MIIVACYPGVAFYESDLLGEKYIGKLLASEAGLK